MSVKQFPSVRSSRLYCAGLLWTAPELLRKADDGLMLSEAELQRADVYSFSIVLFEVLYRSYPFDTDPMTPAGTLLCRITVGGR